MHLEIAAAVDFLMKVLSLKKTLKPDQLDSLGKNLATLLHDRYRGHWYPNQPARGQAFRCIRINHWQFVDESLLQACTRCGIEYSRLPLPDEITLWIDPFEVSARIGEHKDNFRIATFQPVVNEPSPCRIGEHKDYFTMATFQPIVNEDPSPRRTGEHMDYYKMATLQAVLNEPSPPISEYETSDYSSDDLSSESVSESSSDDEISEEKSEIVEKEVVVAPTCNSPDEAIDTPSASNAGTPVSELFASDQETNDTDASDGQETTHV